MLILSMLGLLLMAEPIETQFVRVAPSTQASAVTQPSIPQDRAVVLLHGLRVQPFSSRKVRQAEFQPWQKPLSRLVQALAPHADVFAFAYSQNADLATIAAHPALAEHVQGLRDQGYREVVLVGHSAGGLLARHFVEDHPRAGVTKVIQVCAPNVGSSWGNLKLGVCECQEPFLDSLTKPAREASLMQRQHQRVPTDVEFVCLVGQLRLDQFRLDCGDGILNAASQWPRDLQEQGIPAHPLPVAHFTAMYSLATAQQIATLLCQPQPRWTGADVAAARAGILQRLETEEQ